MPVKGGTRQLGAAHASYGRYIHTCQLRAAVHWSGGVQTDYLPRLCCTTPLLLSHRGTNTWSDESAWLANGHITEVNVELCTFGGINDVPCR